MAVETDILTYGVVGTVVTAGGIVIAAINWLNKTFQTREAARLQMNAINEKFDTLDSRMEARLVDIGKRVDEKFRENDVRIEGVHNHIRHLSSDLIDRMKQHAQQTETNQRAILEVASNVSYMKGKMEPHTLGPAGR